MVAVYDSSFVVLSIVIAVGASFVALDLTGRTAVARGSLRTWWLVGGSFAFGTGIWSMHYIGMLAYRLPVEVRYDIPLVVLSFVAACAASLMALLVVTREDIGAQRTIVGSLVMGGGISVMHYIGMAAMRLPAHVTWHRGLVLASVLIAVGVSAVALLLASSLRNEQRSFAPRKVLAAVLMGVAIATMHYTGMAAASWTSASMSHNGPGVAVTSLGVGAIVSVTAIIFAFVFVLSIVDRKLSARSRQLRESEARYRELFERSLTGHYRSARDGRLLECNEAFAKMFGYATPADCVARLIDDSFLHTGERRAFVEVLDRDGKIVAEEREMRRPDGSRFWILEHAALVPSRDGSEMVIEGSVIDITRRKEADAALARAVAASDAANRAKSEFLANMSHEIRTPMNGVIGVTELVLQSKLSTEQRESMELIKLSAESLLDIINDILDFSKIEAGRVELDPVDFEPARLFEDSARTLAPRAHLKGLELICDLSSGLPSRVVGDPGRLRQILLNLLGNAIKFTSEGEVELRAVWERGDAEETVLHISVRDTGVGIPPEMQRRIFEPFSQADASTTRRFGGTGLGLTITSHLVELMRGSVTVESTPNVGSTFHVRIPMTIAETAPTEAPPLALADLKGMRVLVVDDNQTNRRILAETLRGWGFSPTSVAEGRAAIEELVRSSAAGEPYGVVLLDFQLPDLDGFGVAEEIQRREDVAGTVILMLSSLGQEGDGARARALGVRVLLTKPVRQSVLLEHLLRQGTRAKAAVAGVVEPPSGPSVAKRISPARPVLGAAERALRILLAEDNPVNQIVASKILQARGHAVVVVSDGAAAVDRSAAEHFDVILMDVQMPVMDGRAATVAIREREASTGRRVQIIALTASAMEEDREQCLAAGMDGFLSKPIQLAQFVDEIEGQLPRPSVQ